MTNTGERPIDYVHTLYDEQWTSWSDGSRAPLSLNPNALSTTRYDDTARLLRNEGGELLELGCGTGDLTLALADRFEKLVGLDLSRSGIEIARKRKQEAPLTIAPKLNWVQIPNSHERLT